MCMIGGGGRGSHHYLKCSGVFDKFVGLIFVLFCFGMFLTCSNPHGFRASFGETVGGSTSAA